MVIKNVYKKGFITTSLMNETSTWEQQIFYANQETIELFNHNYYILFVIEFALFFVGGNNAP